MNNATKLNNGYLKVIGMLKVTPENLKIFNEDCDRILKEDRHPETNIGQAAIGYLKKCLKDTLTKVDNETLQDKLLQSWVHYNDFFINCSNNDLYLMCVDFNQPMIAAEQLNKLAPSFDVDALSKELGGMMAGTNGLYVPMDDRRYVIFIDSKCKEKDTRIQHEFCYYVESVTGAFILDDGSVKDSILDYFGINDELAKYLMNENEFFINLYTDIFNRLQTIYWMTFSKLYSWDKFIDFIFNDLKTTAYSYESSQLFHLWTQTFDDNSFFIRVLACISYVNADFYKDIVGKLKNKGEKKNA